MNYPLEIECWKCKKPVMVEKPFQKHRIAQKIVPCRKCILEAREERKLVSHNKIYNDGPYTRECPRCKSEITHSTMYSRNMGIKKNGKCARCRHELNSSHPVWKSKEFLEKMSKVSSGENNPMHGRTFYETWVEKYGKEEADKKLEKFKKHRKETAKRGVLCHSYGKAPPRGTGNGWKGWYKDFFFRSLRELTFVLSLDKQKIEWKTGETLKYNIKYNFMGAEKTYRPDFIVGDTLYEIKPTRLINSPNVLAKTEAAQKFCAENNLKYIITDIKIDASLILLNISKIKFDKRYVDRFLDFCKKDKLEIPLVLDWSDWIP